MKLNRPFHRLSAISLFGLTLGCASVAVNQKTELPVTAPAAFQAQQDAGQDAASMGWLAGFNDADLDALVNEAVSANFDLRSVASRVQAAQAQMRIANANRWPQLAAVLSGSRSEQNANVFNFQTQQTERRQIRNDDFSLQAQLSWELDLWGRLADQTRATLFDYQASDADYAAARLSLAANVARARYDALTAQRQLELAQHTAESFAQSLAVIEERYRSGIGDALDVSLARANAASAQAQLEARRVQVDNTVLALETLLGRYPQRALLAQGDLPGLQTTPAAGAPAALLERRPDLQAARLRLLAATSRQAAADKNLLPSLSLTGAIGTSSDQFADIFDLDDLVKRIAAQLTAPVFQAGRLKAQREQAEALQEQAVWDYASVALQAFREVESALRAEGYLAGQEQALAATARESALAEELAGERYAGGLIDIITLLESQRRAFDARRALIDIRNQRLQNRINLYLALGGDFAPVAEVASASDTAIADNAQGSI